MRRHPDARPACSMLSGSNARWISAWRFDNTPLGWDLPGRIARGRRLHLSNCQRRPPGTAGGAGAGTVKAAASRTFSQSAKSPQDEIATKLLHGDAQSLPTGSAGDYTRSRGIAPRVFVYESMKYDPFVRSSCSASCGSRHHVVDERQCRARPVCDLPNSRRGVFSRRGGADYSRRSGNSRRRATDGPV